MKTIVRIPLVLLALASLAAPTLASAQDGGGEGGGVIYEPETEYNFDEEYIDGRVVRPDGELIAGQRHGKDSSLIRIRSDFLPELVESVEDL